uniref:HEAT repeat family protein n=1 Tax=Wuchereria bancrofti TaxID=6293 RepID=A0A1I8EUK9_WUCBA
MSNTEDGKDEEIERLENKIDWESLLNVANDPDFNELLQSPVDDAISILKTGREIQKLSVIRTLNDLLESDGDQVIEKVMPAIQEMLVTECSNLDIQCEAAVTYKNIYRNSKLTAHVPGIADVILNVTAAAWLETLVEVIDQIPVSQLKQLIVPLTISQAETSQRAQRRVLATKLVDKLCRNLESFDIRRDIIPCVQMLCNDPNSNVRSSMAQHLAVVAESLRNPSDCGSALVPCLVQLCKDTEIGTREAALNTIALCIPFLSKEQRKCSIIPLLKRSTEQAISAQDETLTVIAKNLGQWIDILEDVLTIRDYNWFLDIYVQIANLPQCPPSSDNGISARSNIQTSARRMCAYNFPCMVLKYGADFFKNRLLPILEGFCCDPDDDIRCATAAGFHEVVKLMPNEPSLLPPFFELIRGSPAEVVGHLMGSLDQVLPSLYGCVSEQNNCQISRLQLDHIVIGCNRLIRRTSSWRAQYSYLQNIAVLRHLIPVKDLFISFVPMLKQEVLTTRAIPCRVAASITLLLFMRENPNEVDRQSIINFFIHSIAKHQNCHRRRLFLEIIPEIIANFSRNFFHTHFLTPILEMANDKVASIRLQLCHMLSKIKANLYLPEDEEILLRVEAIIRNLLSKEQNSSTRQLIQTYACELSRAETRNKSDKSDELKQKAENEIWNQKELTLEEASKSNTSEECLRSEKRINDKNDGHLDKSRWRTHIQRSKTAIVRPQPQVVVTQRSPSPMPLVDTKYKTATVASQATSSVRSILPLTNRRDSTQMTTKSSLSIGRRSSTTLAGKPPTGLSADNTNARRSSVATVMSRSVSSLNGKVGLISSQSTDSITLFGQGLMKVRSFSNIARTPSHLSMKVKNKKYSCIREFPDFTDSDRLYHILK